MRLFIAVWAVCILTAAAQEKPADQLKHLSVPTVTSVRPVTIAAMEIDKQPTYPSVMYLTGNVEIRTPVCLLLKPDDARTYVCDGSVVLRADKATFHEDTGQVEASGNVRVTRERSADSRLGR
jgi:lipopolysaccharide assembly outer membrane protein LptD (OstA)